MKVSEKTVVQFKARPCSGSHELKIPKLQRKHVVTCSKGLYGFINSNMCEGFIRRELVAKYGKNYSRVDPFDLPEGVSVEDTGFLKTVTMTL